MTPQEIAQFELDHREEIFCVAEQEVLKWLDNKLTNGNIDHRGRHTALRQFYKRWGVDK